MPRNNFTLVRYQNGELTADRYDSADAVRDAIAKLDEDEPTPVLFNASAIAFTVHRKPTVVFGAPAPARGKKATPRKPKAKAPNGSSGTRFDADGTRVVDTDPESTPATRAPAEQHTDVEA